MQRRVWATLAVIPFGQIAGAGGIAPFTEESAVRGLAFETRFHGIVTWGHGVCFADLDGDRDPDLVAVGGEFGAVGVWENDGTGHFVSRAAGSGIFPSVPYSNVTAADIDNDGDLDLLLGQWDLPNRVFRNDGGFAFTDVSTASGLNHYGRNSSVAWGDYDGNGAIDVYVANWDALGTHNNILCRNNGDGTFLDVAPALGVDYHRAMTYAVTLFDYDRDGDLDLYVANDRGPSLGCQWPNKLWRNNGGYFSDISAASGAGVCLDSMSATVGDFDRNLWPDLYVTNTPSGNALLLNQGGGTFVESAAVAGVDSNAWGWGAQFFDFDNDGREDLFVCNEDAPDRLYRSDGSWPAADVAPAAGVDDAGPSYTVAYADVDGDGDIDFVVSPEWGPIRLYINNEGEQRNWLRIVPVNRHGVAASGASAVVTAGGVPRYAQLVHNSGYKSQNEHVLHFGLGGLDSAAEVTVTWPGIGSRTFVGVEANQVLVVSPCGADLTADGALDGNDVTAFLAAFIGRDSGADLAPPKGIFDPNDIMAFFGEFQAGCDWSPVGRRPRP